MKTSSGIDFNASNIQFFLRNIGFNFIRRLFFLHPFYHFVLLSLPLKNLLYCNHEKLRERERVSERETELMETVEINVEM